MHGEGLNEGLDLMHINLDDHGTKRAACNWRSYYSPVRKENYNT